MHANYACIHHLHAFINNPLEVCNYSLDVCMHAYIISIYLSFACMHACIYYIFIHPLHACMHACMHACFVCMDACVACIEMIGDLLCILFICLFEYAAYINLKRKRRFFFFFVCGVYKSQYKQINEQINK